VERRKRRKFGENIYSDYRWMHLGYDHVRGKGFVADMQNPTHVFHVLYFRNKPVSVSRCELEFADQVSSVPVA
jgi:hypothetical protein